MERRSRKLSLCAAAFLLELIGVLLCLNRVTPLAGAQNLRVMQVWPDRSAGVSSGSLESPEAITATKVLPFGVFRAPEGDVVRARTYLRFPLNVCPPGTDVLRATLYVYVDRKSGAGEAKMGAYRVLELWEERDVGHDPATWPALMRSPVAVTTARFDATSPAVVATPTPTATATPTPTSTPTLTVTDVSRSRSKPAGHGLTQDQDTVVFLTPSEAEVAVGYTRVVSIYVENVDDLYGVDLYLKFDPALLEVVDADLDEDGVQIQAGLFLPPDVTEQNIVYQEDGEIYFVASQEESREPVAGSGTLALITWRGKAVGVSDVEFRDVLLFDQDGMIMSTDIRDGRITVVGRGATTPTPTPTLTPTRTPTPGATATSSASPLPTPTPPSAFDGPVVSLTGVTGTWLKWDVTVLMRAWLAGEIPDAGLALASAPDPAADPEEAGNLLLAHWLVSSNAETKPYLIAEFEVHPVTPTPTCTPVPVLPPAGNSRGGRVVGVLLVGLALFLLGLAMRRG